MSSLLLITIYLYRVLNLHVDSPLSYHLHAISPIIRVTYIPLIVCNNIFTSHVIYGCKLLNMSVVYQVHTSSSDYILESIIIK